MYRIQADFQRCGTDDEFYEDAVRTSLASDSLRTVLMHYLKLDNYLDNSFNEAIVQIAKTLPLR